MNKRAAKTVLAAVWALVVIVLLGFAVSLLRKVVSVPVEPDTFVSPQPPQEPEEREVKLFFADADASSLVPEKRFIRLGTGVQADAVAIANELVKGPQLEGLSPTIPPETRLLNAYVTGDLLVLDFSSELQKNHPGGSTGELTTVYSIVNTMVENLPGVKEVQILLEGDEMETLAGHMDLSRPLYPDAKWMKVLPRPKSAS